MAKSNERTVNMIEFWRVIFTLMIAVYHFNNTYSISWGKWNLTPGWYIGVEFFFIVSGYLLASRSRVSNETVNKYILHDAGGKTT